MYLGENLSTARVDASYTQETSDLEMNPGGGRGGWACRVGVGVLKKTDGSPGPSLFVIHPQLPGRIPLEKVAQAGRRKQQERGLGLVV